jgi:fructose-1-phosphate kinase PfkB-like protein
VPQGVKPNVGEASEVLGRSMRSEEDMRLVLQEFLDVGIQLVALSRGASWALVGSQEGIIRAIHSHP